MKELLSGSPVIEIERASFSYEGAAAAALTDFSLRVFPGQCVLLCGSSGCGKTTVTRLLNGLIPHYYEGRLSGKVSVCGTELARTPLEALAGKVGSVFQNPRSQFFCVDTTSEVAFGCENMGLPADTIRARVSRTAERMKIETLLGRNIFGLSGGEKQKIACAGVAAMEPEVFVLDEPTSNLDLTSIRELREILLLWKQAGKTVVIAEHRLGWLKGVCDRVVLLGDGAVLEELDGAAFFQKTDGALHSLGLRGAGDAADLTEGPAGFYPLGGAGAEETGEKLVFSDFIYHYGKRRALAIERLEIPLHAVVAVIGRNGAGKSTFAGCLCGLQKGFRGSVTAGGRTWKGRRLRGLSYMVMQDVNHQLFAESVLEEVTLGMAGADEVRAMEALRRLGLEALKDRHPMSLSGGQKQRTAIAAAFTSGRPVLVLDEPTSGLDHERMCQTAGLIRAAGGEKTVFVVTHDMELVRRCCTHVLHIENGTLCPGATPE